MSAYAVLFSQLTVSKYHTVRTGLQKSCRPAEVEFFEALNGSIWFCTDLVWLGGGGAQCETFSWVQN